MKIELKYNTLYIEMDHVCMLEDIFQHFHISRKQRYLLFKKQAIRIQKTIIHENQSIAAHQVVCINITTYDTDDINPSYVPIDIVFEDSLFLIVNKPKHILVHSDGINIHDTLCNRVKGYYIETKQELCVRPIHRLDMDTTGLVLFCKISFFQPLLDHMLEQKLIHREYDAFVKGFCKVHKKMITYPIARDRHDAKKMRISKQGKPSKTIVTTIQASKHYSHIHCILESGRTHQIRIHLSAINHPILSDPLYGTLDSCIQRLALHAGNLSFYHPIQQETFHIQCPLPDDMQLLSL